MKKTFMIMATFSAVLLASAPVWAGKGTPGHPHIKGHHDDHLAFGVPGDAKKPSRDMVVVMKEEDGKMLFSPNKFVVKKGEQIRFKLKNEGEIDHEIVLATLEANLQHAKEMEKNPDMEHDDPNAKRLGPGAYDEILWKFTEAGMFDFSCLIPGHREAGMSGAVLVK